MNAELDCGSDAAAYVLGALDEAGAEAFRRHIDTCAACRDEALALQAAADVLPLMVPQLKAPANVRKRVMAEVRADVAAGARARAGRRSARSLPRVRLGGGLPIPAMAGALVLLVAAIVTAAALSGGGSAGTRVVRAQVAFGPGTAVVKLTDGHGQLLATGMPAAPSGKVYEVWVKRGSAAPRPTNALFEVTAAGAAAVDVPGDLSGVTTVLVTAERDGGSRVPHGHPVLIANL